MSCNPGTYQGVIPPYILGRIIDHGDDLATRQQQEERACRRCEG